MRAWVHLLCVAASIAAPVGLTLLTTRSGGARSQVHYQEVSNSAMGTREVMMAFERMAFDERKPTEAVSAYVAPDFVDHNSETRGDRAPVLGSGLITTM
jgi:hypothetical protein